MGTRKTLYQAICLGIVIGLLNACGAQQDERASQSRQLEPIEPLTQLSPTGSSLQGTASPDPLKAVIGQTIYVPAYSYIYYGKGEEYLLAITLSIRNTSLSDPISVTSIRYYNSQGNLVKEFAQKSLQIPPMATAEFFVEERDTSGGSGANFLVEWVAEKEVSEPVVEAVMVGTSFQQGVSLVSPGRVIE